MTFFILVWLTIWFASRAQALGGCSMAWILTQRKVLCLLLITLDFSTCKYFSCWRLIITNEVVYWKKKLRNKRYWQYHNIYPLTNQLLPFITIALCKVYLLSCMLTEMVLEQSEIYTKWNKWYVGNWSTVLRKCLHLNYLIDRAILGDEISQDHF